MDKKKLLIGISSCLGIALVAGITYSCFLSDSKSVQEQEISEIPKIEEMQGTKGIQEKPQEKLSEKQKEEVVKEKLRKIFENMFALADKGETVNFLNRFFTAEEMSVAFESNYGFMVMRNANPPVYALINFNKLKGIDSEKNKVQEKMKDINLEKGISDISQEELNKIKEVCGENCIILKKDEKTLGVYSFHPTSLPKTNYIPSNNEISSNNEILSNNTQK